MVDATYTEVAGLGATFNLFISKNGGGFNPSAGTKTEISNGWYSYLSTAAEANTVGPIAIYVTGAGAIQQNMEFTVEQRTSGAHAFTYILTNSVTGFVVPGAEVWITPDILGANVIWNGYTDAFGVARDGNGNLPVLDDGTYYFWARLSGFTANAWPDIETVS